MKKSNDKVNLSNIVKRLKCTTPPFWKDVRMYMLSIGAIGGALLIAPVALPALLLTAAGYMVAIGSVGTALASITKTDL